MTNIQFQQVIDDNDKFTFSSTEYKQQAAYT